MLKKLFTGLLIISLFNYLNCVTLFEADKEEVKEEIKNGEFKGYLYIITLDDNRYRFEDWSCHIENDTLYGIGYKIGSVGQHHFAVKIPFEEIKYLEIKKTNYFLTIGCLSILSIGLLLVIVAATYQPKGCNEVQIGR